MSIIKINSKITPNQAVVFDEVLDPCDSCYDEESCSPVIDGDTLDFQIRQTPCGPNLICDPEFKKLSLDLITNGRFKASLAGWTAGAGWTWTGGVTQTAKVIASTAAFTQDLTGLITDLRYYYIRVKVLVISGTPDLRIKLGGTQQGPAITAGGQVTILAIADNINNLISFNDGTGTATYTIDNVELFDVNPCWDLAGGWIYTGDGIVSSGTTNALSPLADPLTSGQYYRIRISVDSVTAGSFKPRAGTTLGKAISADGDYIDYILSNGTAFSIVPDINFDGHITFIEVKQMKNDWTVGLIDLTDNTEYTATDIITYFEDRVTFKINPSLWLPEPFSCFKLILHDLCDEYSDNLICNGNFIVNDSDCWIGGANWFHDFRREAAYLLVGGLWIQPFDGSPTEDIVFTGIPGLCRKWYWEMKVDGLVNATSYVVLAIGGHFLPLVIAKGVYSGVANLPVLLSNALRLEAAGDPTADAIDILYATDVLIQCITEIDHDYVSQCFMFNETAGCTKLLTAYCDKPAFNIDFPGSGFKLKLRIDIAKFDPIYPEEQSNYIYSDGTKKIIFASTDDLINLGTDFIPDWAHRCLRVMKICDHFLIETTEYVCKEGDYIPEYLDGEHLRLSAVQLQIRPKTLLQQNNNCE